MIEHLKEDYYSHSSALKSINNKIEKIRELKVVNIINIEAFKKKNSSSYSSEMTMNVYIEVLEKEVNKL